jgi:outer membrane protein TolC
LNAAIEAAIASRYNREVVTITTLSSVANTYFQILATRDRLRIARRNLGDSSRILFLIREQFEAGTASDLNLAQQESLVEQVRATIRHSRKRSGRTSPRLRSSWARRQSTSIRGAPACRTSPCRA